MLIFGVFAESKKIRYSTRYDHFFFKFFFKTAAFDSASYCLPK
jgi:hypothetical protein